MIEGYPNNVEKLEEKLTKEMEFWEDNHSMIAFKTRDLVESEWRDKELKSEIEERCGVENAIYFEKALLEGCIKFIKSENPTDEEFDSHWKKIHREYTNNVLQSMSDKHKENERKFSMMDNYSSFEL